MAPDCLRVALRYGCHSLVSQDATFVRSELRTKTAMGYIVVLPREDVRDLLGLCMIPLGLIPQEGRPPCLIYDYTWSSLNAAVLCQAPTEAMQFTHMVMRLLCTILDTNLWGGPVFMSKIDLVDAYIRLWLRS